MNEEPLQYMSSDSPNVYTVIAQKGKDAEIGLNLQINTGALVMRFCVFADAQPELKVFSFRYGSKTYTQYPLSADTIERTGCPLDMVTVPVIIGKNITAQQVIQALDDDEGWDKLADWVTHHLKLEGFELGMDPGGFVMYLRKMVLGVGLEKPVVDIKYPGPLVKTQKPKIAPPPADDGAFEDDD